MMQPSCVRQQTLTDLLLGRGPVLPHRAAGEKKPATDLSFGRNKISKKKNDQYKVRSDKCEENKRVGEVMSKEGVSLK